MSAATKISIPRTEYTRLKKFEAEFRRMALYFSEAKLIEQARKEVRAGKGFTEAQVIKKLGL